MCTEAQGGWWGEDGNVSSATRAGVGRVIVLGRHRDGAPVRGGSTPAAHWYVPVHCTGAQAVVWCGGCTRG